MDRKNILFICFLLSLIICKSEALKCGEKEIENCQECGKDEAINTCVKCEDKHFLFFNNLYCIPCDDPKYGQIGCEGNCNASNYKEFRNVLCDECKEGYYNLEGFCYSCSEGAYGCKTCIIEFNNNNNNEKIYKCTKCINDEYMLDKVSNQCYYCGMGNCEKCHYIVDNNDEYYYPICEKCIYGYYLNEQKECQICNDPVDINNGKCRVCSNNETDYESGLCWCDIGYTLSSHSTCVKCPDNCPYCEYNKNKKETECIRCEEGYAINSEKHCQYCGDGCEYCFLSDNSIPVCTLCFSRTFISDNSKCLVCPNNCKNCKYDENNQIKCIECNYRSTFKKDGTCEECPPFCSSCFANENDDIVCQNCFEHYTLNSEAQCVDCREITDKGMKGCERCRYNSIKKKFECHECAKKRIENSYQMIEAYAYVTNTFECFDNSSPDNKTFYGCLKAYYNESTEEYECLACITNYYTFIMVVNDKICIPNSILGGCQEAENLGSKNEPKYSCTKCSFESTKIKTLENTIRCPYRDNNLAFCLEGEEEINNIEKCTKCVSNADFSNTNICECNSDSFGLSMKWCYKCDDKYNGNPGCLSEKGCNYYYESFNQLNCNECKIGYYKYSEGQCYSCSYEIRNCEQCHYEESSSKLICDKCLDEYVYNEKERICEIKNCEDYPEISEGCIICEEKLEDFLSKKQCQKCKPGYFKTKNNQCVNCKEEKYGGPACYKCSYEIDENGEETDDIKCNFCPENKHAINSKGKCFNCKQFFGDTCDICEFKDDNNTEKIVCSLCSPGYYLNSEGKCINYLKYLEKVENCNSYTYKINNIPFCIHFYNKYEEYKNGYYSYIGYCYIYYDYKYYYGYSFSFYNDIYSFRKSYEYSNYYNITNFNIPEITEQINTQCIYCPEGYYYNSDGKCVSISIEECTLISIVDNFPEKYEMCRSICDSDKNVYVNLNVRDKNNNNNVKLDIRQFFEEKFSYYTQFPLKETLDEELKFLFIKNLLCISRGDTNEKYKNCKRVEYVESTNTYICSECISDSYILDSETNSCKEYDYYFREYNCVIENIGTTSNPIYSCKKCYNDNDYLLVTNENNIKYCKYKRSKEEEEIEYCNEAIENTTYINSVYNCSNCSINFIPFYSKFFGKVICQNVFDDIITKKDNYLDKFMKVESIPAVDGICGKNLFTPDGINCYPCNSEVGMPGCKGPCNFSLERNNILKCEEECVTGYIEVSEGVCESCDSVNHGCYECHYESEYPTDYLGIKRKRRFICDYCQENYNKLDGKCQTCEDLGLGNCEKCEINPYNNKYICKKCNKFSHLIDGNCENCDSSGEFQLDNECYQCNDYKHGGIKGCTDCEKKDNNQLICQICEKGYILLTNNNTCLDLNENKELERFNFCEQLTLGNNNQLYCSKCKEEYSLLKDSNNNKGECRSIPILYDVTAFDYCDYYSDYIEDYNLYKNGYYDDEYLYYKSYNKYPCQESINLGTVENPLYSCTKCYQRFIYEKSYKDVNYYTRIINQRNNVSYCVNKKEIKDLENCTEAINMTKNGVEKYDCLKCYEDNKLLFDPETGIHYCKYAYNSKLCMVKYCKTCKNGNNYFCNECLLSNYEVNSVTGSCVEKSEIVPAITWKDIFRLEMNSNKEINGQTYYGPSIRLRGITTSEINTRHAFLIYLTFKIKAGRNRNLQEIEEKKIPAICEVINNADNSNDDVNIIDYECISNTTQNEDLTDYQLDNIDEGNNEGILKQSNLKDLVEKTTLEELETKEEPAFKLADLGTISTFYMDKIINQTSINYTFDFKIDGQINKDINPVEIETELELNEIEEKACCNFVVEENKKANLNCKINIENYKDKNLFTFKTTEIISGGNDIFLSKIDEVLLINDIEKQKKEDKEKEEEEEKKEEGENKKAKIYLIIGCVVGFLVLSGIVVFIIIRVKIIRKKNINNNDNEKSHGIKGNTIKFENSENNLKTQDKILNKKGN